MKTLGIVANHDKPEALRLVDQLEKWASDHAVKLVTDKPLSGEEPLRFSALHTDELRERFAGCDLVLSLGGDGTLLYASRVVAPLQVPVLSINLGSLGFHTQVRPSEMFRALESFDAGNYRVENRTMLQAQLEGPQPPATMPAGTVLLALNDVVVSRSAWGRMVHLRLTVNEKPASDVFADGLIISTPTGSSAYNYAAHGPVLEPGLDAMVLNAICPHRMNFSPIVLSSGAKIRLEFHPRKTEEQAHLLVDGWHWCNVSHEHCLKISRAPMYLPLVVFDDDFFQKLREKLAWGGLN